MPIVTSFSIPIQPAKARGKRLPLAANKPQPLFGRMAPVPPKDHDSYTYRQNIIYSSTEPPEGKQGGLGEVTGTIPPACIKFSTPPGHEHEPRDFRVITPFIKTAIAQNEKDKAENKEHFKLTNMVIPVVVKGKRQLFQVLQKEESVPGSKQKYWRYAIANKELFSKVDKIQTYNAYAKNSVELTMPYNQAVAKLVYALNGNTAGIAKPEGELPYIDPSCTNGEENLSRFNGQVNVAIGNDWLSGPMLYQDGIRENKNIRKIFYLHNTYDNAVFAEEAGYDRDMPLPTDLTQAKQIYSPLSLAIKSADAVIANKNYVKTLVNTPFAKGQVFVDALKAHLDQGTIFDMHHGLADDFTPTDNEFLRENKKIGYENIVKKAIAEKREIPAENPNQKDYQFVELNKDLKPESWVEFKQKNKIALQNKYGLNENPNAVILTWAARLDPNQKGFYLVQNTMMELLKKHPNLQIMVAGNVGGNGPNEKKITDWINEINQKYPGRVYIPNAFVGKTEITQMNSGSDFTMLPSVYEPYGLTQLEALKMGSIPLVNAVDGLRTTISDPLWNGKDFIGATGDGKEAVWDYGQTGIIIEPFDIPTYRKSLERQHCFTDLKKKVDDAPGKVYLPAKNPKAAFKQLRELLEPLPLQKWTDKQTGLEHERFNPAEKQQIEALHTRLLGDQPTLSQADLGVLKMILGKDKAHYLKPAEASFATGVDRAVEMSADPAKMAEVRKNGLAFLDAKHNWETIIKERYIPVFDSDKKKTDTEIHFNETPPFPRTPLETVPTVNPLRRPATAKTQPSGLWAEFKNSLAAMIYYLNIFNWFKSSIPKAATTPEQEQSPSTP